MGCSYGWSWVTNDHWSWLTIWFIMVDNQTNFNHLRCCTRRPSAYITSWSPPIIAGARCTFFLGIFISIFYLCLSIIYIQTQVKIRCVASIYSAYYQGTEVSFGTFVVTFALNADRWLTNLLGEHGKEKTEGTKKPQDGWWCCPQQARETRWNF